MGRGIKNVVQLTLPEIQKVRQLQNEYGLNVSSLGSPIGKVKLLDVEDGTKNVYVPIKKYLAGDVQKACELAHALETKLIRGFSFYPPRGSNPQEHLPQAVDQLGQIAETCHRSDLTFGLEVEANLVGDNGHMLAEIHRQVNHPGHGPGVRRRQHPRAGLQPGRSLRAISGHEAEPGLDAHQGLSSVRSRRHQGGHANDGALAHFVPADQGDAAYEAILRDFSPHAAGAGEEAGPPGIPGVFLDLEPHLKGGGQFGGFSGPDGMGVALRGLCRVLDYVGIDYHLRDFDDVKAARGY